MQRCHAIVYTSNYFNHITFPGNNNVVLHIHEMIIQCCDTDAVLHLFMRAVV